MATQHPPRPLPRSDVLLGHKIMLAIFLGLTLVILALAMANAAVIDARAGQLWHLPWPIAQWALTTPLGTLAVAVVGGLVGGLPLLLPRPEVVRPVDVMQLPPTAWPRPLPPWYRPGRPAPGEDWLGHGRGQRLLSLLALALAVLLVLGSFTIFGAVGWYGITHLPDCSGPRCPPRPGPVGGPAMVIALAIRFLGYPVWIRHIERRCGIWFRSLDGTRGLPGGFTCYVRRPGITVDAAAAALARYTRGGRPVARRTLLSALVFEPVLLVQIVLGALIAWLPTQWIPN